MHYKVRSTLNCNAGWLLIGVVICAHMPCDGFSLFKKRKDDPEANVPSPVEECSSDLVENRRATERKTIAVPANAWADTSLELQKGDILLFTAAGKWSAGLFNRMTDPDGYDAWKKYRFIKSSYCMALIGRIGQAQYFHIGSRRCVRVKSGEYLQLGGNGTTRSDNLGRVTAEVSLYRVTEKVQEPSVAQRPAQQLTLEVNYPPAELQTDRKDLTLVGLAKSAAILQSIEITQNGETVATIRIEAPSVPVKQGIELKPGKNVLVVTATDKNREVIQKAATVLYSPAAVAIQSADPGRCFALLIGISEYTDGSFGKLQFADVDAKEMQAALLKYGKLNKDDVRILLNKDATRKNIQDALHGFLQKAGRNDRIIVYWSGHGFVDPDKPDKCYFACFDTKARRSWSGYEMKRVREALREHEARNVVFIADTCHSAGVFTTRSTKGIRVVGQSPFNSYVRKIQRAGRGMAFLVAGDTDRKALEDSSFKNGAFTHFILAALRGSADGFKGSGEKDGIITLGEVVEFVRDRLPRETLDKLGHAQHPAFFFPTGDPTLRELPMSKIVKPQ
ncbi:MAG: caspase family protein [Planctomycetota bacterium]|nr:caspase family protein [Planctomycetota bacterium]